MTCRKSLKNCVKKVVRPFAPVSMRRASRCSNRRLLGSLKGEEEEGEGFLHYVNSPHHQALKFPGILTVELILRWARRRCITWKTRRMSTEKGLNCRWLALTSLSVNADALPQQECNDEEPKDASASRNAGNRSGAQTSAAGLRDTCATARRYQSLLAPCSVKEPLDQMHTLCCGSRCRTTSTVGEECST